MYISWLKMVFYILRYAEIGLKGKNRSFFENLLIKNIKKILPSSEIKKVQGRFLVNTRDEFDFRRIFGLSSFSNAIMAEPVPELIAESALSLCPDLSSFRVSCQRIDKRMPFKSCDIEVEVGSFLVEKGGKVSLKNFKTEIFVELIEGKAYVFTEKIACFSGLPVGSQSKVAVVLESQNDVLAGLLALKRGCNLFPILKNFSESDILSFFGAEKSVDFKEIDLNKFLKDNNCLLLFSGQNIELFDDFNTAVPVLRPLIFYYDKQIKQELGEYFSVFNK